MENETITPRENLSCAICGYFCNNDHHFNNWFDTTTPIEKPREAMPAGEWVPAEVDIPWDGAMHFVLDNVGCKRLGCFGVDDDGNSYLEIVGTEMYQSYTVQHDGLNHYSWLRAPKD